MAYRISVYIALFFVFAHAGVGMAGAMGVWDYMGLDPHLGDTSEIETAQEQQEFQTGTGQGQTQLGSLSRGGSVFNTFINIIGPGAEMMKNAGMPPPLVNFVYAGLTIIALLDVIKFVLGR